MIRYNKQIIVVTGAASGIGRKTCETLSELGARVVMIDNSNEGLENTLRLLNGDGHQSYCIDLTNFDVVSQTVKQIVECSGPVYGLVHCAGISSRKPLNVLKASGFEKVMNINFYSFVELVKHITKKGYMVEGGSIVVMSSISGFRGYKAKTEYCVSKAAVDAFVRCMALELAPKKIRINSIAPGIVNTELGKKAKEIAMASGSIIETQPLGETEPEEIANLIAFLLSDATKTITGTSIRIDGGACV